MPYTKSMYIGDEIRVIKSFLIWFVFMPLSVGVTLINCVDKTIVKIMDEHNIALYLWDIIMDARKII